VPVGFPECSASDLSSRERPPRLSVLRFWDGPEALRTRRNTRSENLVSPTSGLQVRFRRYLIRAGTSFTSTTWSPGQAPQSAVMKDHGPSAVASLGAEDHDVSGRLLRMNSNGRARCRKRPDSRRPNSVFSQVLPGNAQRRTTMPPPAAHSTYAATWPPRPQPTARHAPSEDQQMAP
jgi:hypothetical protein